MAGIRVNSGAKRIEVNDNGDYIVLNLNDSSFPDRFFTMLDRVQAKTDQVEQEGKALQERYPQDSVDGMRALSALYRELYESVAAEVDGLFGPDTCKKVFGDIVPDIELFDEFFTQLKPYIEEFGKERAKRLSKYSAARTGNV